MSNEQAGVSKPSDAKPAKLPSATSTDPLSELEKKHAKELEKVRFHDSESKIWSAKARATAAQMREIKEKRIHDFIKTSGLTDIRPEAWEASKAAIKAVLEKANAQAAG